MNFNKILILAALIIGLLSMLWFVIAALLEQRVPNALMAKEGYIFDYVVVGAGTAGSVVASLLSKHSNATVLLIEAGDRFGLLSKIPLFTTFQQKGLNDWSFLTTSQKHSSKGLEEQRQSLPRGKGLGGSGELNYMLHSDGYEGDFERWSQDYNLSDWNWLSVKPFLEAGNAKPHERLEIPDSYSKITLAIQKAQNEFMHKPWRFRKARYNIKNGLRYSVYQRFLHDAHKYKNLRIMTNTMAKKIEFEYNKSNDVQVRALKISTKDENTRKEYIFEVEVQKELIVCAGAFQSPQLLMVSGIGEKAELRKRHVAVPDFVPELPAVGQNLHDHINLPLYSSIQVVGPTLNQRSLLDPFAIFNYLTVGSGHLGNFGVLSHIYSLEGNINDTFGLTFFGAGAIDELALMSISNFKRAHFRALFPRYFNTSQEGFVIISNCLQPKSRGNVKIQNANIRKNPLIDPNYLAEQQDVECTIKAIRAAVEIVTSFSFSELGPKIHWPRIKECANFGPFERDFLLNNPSDHYLECILRYVGLGSHHAAGTCTMGNNPENSVVDSNFKVHGIKNLRVIDASVFPTPISGYPNSIVVGLATRGAAMILRDYKRNISK
ncbi:Neither inactivation nor afterpotential protein G [Lucilia cuprina]|uniref:Neither inactivation nor afterpotential protein G n=1 Tax=Lucilia cuprina TaxID=7375 RepID=A0A0L0C7B9_LUCCU|nr:Neither inactivation nor afterpotential protein G [Lucilia cuprina]KNC28170.1 Neither inactivation nor afterpotential protein G [Lucilia cuprina]